MICKKCGNTINEGEMVCSNCGERVEQTTIPGQNQNPVQQQNNIGMVNEGMQMNNSPQQTGIANNNLPPTNQIQNNSIPNQNIPDAQQQNSIPPTNNNIGNTQVNPQQLNQQPITQPTPTEQPPQINEKKKGGKGLFIVIIILLLAVIGGLVFYILKGKSTDNNQSETQGTTDTTNTTETTETTEASPVANSNTETIGGLTVTIPEGLVHEVTTETGEELLMITDKDRTMVAAIKIYNQDISAYLTAEAITKQMEAEGITNGTATVTKYGDYTYANYRALEATSGYQVNYYMGQVEDKAAAGFLFEGKNYNAETAFGYISSIAKSATGTSSSVFNQKLPKINSNNSFVSGLK